MEHSCIFTLSNKPNMASLSYNIAKHFRMWSLFLGDASLWLASFFFRPLLAVLSNSSELYALLQTPAGHHSSCYYYNYDGSIDSFYILEKVTYDLRLVFGLDLRDNGRFPAKRWERAVVTFCCKLGQVESTLPVIPSITVFFCIHLFNETAAI